MDISLGKKKKSNEVSTNVKCVYLVLLHNWSVENSPSIFQKFLEIDYNEIGVKVLPSSRVFQFPYLRT